VTRRVKHLAAGVVFAATATEVLSALQPSISCRILPDSQLCPRRDRAALSRHREFLVKPHHEPDTPVVTIMFFVGFLGLLALEMPNG
jgi:hypothetical protein